MLSISSARSKSWIVSLVSYSKSTESSPNDQIIEISQSLIKITSFYIDFFPRINVIFASDTFQLLYILLTIRLVAMSNHYWVCDIFVWCENFRPIYCTSKPNKITVNGFFHFISIEIYIDKLIQLLLTDYFINNNNNTLDVSNGIKNGIFVVRTVTFKAIKF